MCLSASNENYLTSDFIFHLFIYPIFSMIIEIYRLFFINDVHVKVYLN